MARIKNPQMLAVGDGEEAWDGKKVLNGVIKEYLATSGTIEANTFVEFVNTAAGGKDTELLSTYRSGENISATLLDESKVFIIHRNDYFGSISGVICTVHDNTISIGTDTFLYGMDSMAIQIRWTASIATLDRSKVFIAYSHAISPSSSDFLLYGMVCTVDGNIITKNTDVQLTPIGNEANYVRSTPSATTLNDSKVFISVGVNTYMYLRGIVCEIIENTITAGTVTNLYSLSGDGTGFSTSSVTLSESRVFLSYYVTDQFYGQHPAGLYGTVCDISGTVITRYTEAALVPSENETCRPSTIAMTSSDIFIPYSKGSFDNLYAATCTISDTIVTQGTNTQLSPTNYSGLVVSPILLNANKVVIMYSGDYNADCRGYIPHGMTCTISKGAVTVLNDIKLLTVNNSGHMLSGAAVLLDQQTVFMAYNFGERLALHGLLSKQISGITATTSKNFDGLTKTKCTTTIPGEVWVANLDSLTK